MTHFTDLSPCDYFPFKGGDRLIAVGWLESGHEFSRSEVPDSLIARLTELLVNPWQPAVTMGSHDCAFCRFNGGSRQFTYNNTTINTGINNLFVPSDNCIFVAPSLIVHYIDAHDYGPPESFRDAVMACPDMRSMAYLRAIRKLAPKEMFATSSPTL